MNVIDTLLVHKSAVALAAVGVVVLLVGAAGAFSMTKRVAPVGWGWYGPVHSDRGVALAGWDAVSYRDGEPVRGSAERAAHYLGVTWHFASEANLAAFEADPERFAPAFGGFCSFAVSKGFTAASSPEAWHVADDRLFLFDSEGMKANWLADFDGNLAASVRNWARRQVPVAPGAP